MQHRSHLQLATYVLRLILSVKLQSVSLSKVEMKLSGYGATRDKTPI